MKLRFPEGFWIRAVEDTKEATEHSKIHSDAGVSHENLDLPNEQQH